MKTFLSTHDTIVVCAEDLIDPTKDKIITKVHLGVDLLNMLIKSDENESNEDYTMTPVLITEFDDETHHFTCKNKNGIEYKVNINSSKYKNFKYYYRREKTIALTLEYSDGNRKKLTDSDYISILDKNGICVISCSAVDDISIDEDSNIVFLNKKHGARMTLGRVVSVDGVQLFESEKYQICPFLAYQRISYSEFSGFLEDFSIETYQKIAIRYKSKRSKATKTIKIDTGNNYGEIISVDADILGEKMALGFTVVWYDTKRQKFALHMAGNQYPTLLWVDAAAVANNMINSKVFEFDRVDLLCDEKVSKTYSPDSISFHYGDDDFDSHSVGKQVAFFTASYHDTDTNDGPTYHIVAIGIVKSYTVTPRSVKVVLETDYTDHDVVVENGISDILFGDVQYIPVIANKI